MALSFTPAGTEVNTTSAPTSDGAGGFFYETGAAWTAPNGSLVVVVTTSRDNNSVTAYNHATITMGGLVFHRVDDASRGSTNDSLVETWVAVNDTGSDVTAKTRATYTETKTGGHLQAGVFTGLDISAGALACVRGYNDAGNSSSGSLIMDRAYSTTNNRTWAAFFVRANEAITLDPNFTQMGGGNFGTPSSSLASGADLTAWNPTPDASWISSVINIVVAMEVRLEQVDERTQWGAGAPNYRFRTGSPWERPLGPTPPLHPENDLLLRELNGQYLVAANGSVADDHPFASGTEVDGALASAIDANAGTTSIEVTAGTVTTYQAAGLAPPFAIAIGTGVNTERMTVSAWGGAGNTTWTIKRTHTPKANAGGTRVRHGKAYLNFVGGYGDATASSSFDLAIYRITNDALPFTIVYPKNQAPDYGTGWTGSVGKINRRFLNSANGGTGPGVRIPEVAKDYFNAESGGLNSDAPLLIMDTNGDSNYLAWFSEMHYYPSVDRWHCQGASIYYYNSYGVDAKAQTIPTDWPATLEGTGINPLQYQDTPENGGNEGHRGVNSQAACVDWDRLYADGGAFQSFGCFMERTSDPGDVHYFPLTGSEHNKGGIIYEGTRFHIKNDVDVYQRCVDAGYTGDRLREVAAIAKSLQDYGIFATDNSGSGCNLKLQNTIRDGRENLWSAHGTDLQIFPFIDDWEVILPNWDPTTSTGLPQGIGNPHRWKRSRQRDAKRKGHVRSYG